MSASPTRLFLLPAIAGMFALTGCGTYRNATAYFNTYYNTSRLFDQAVTELMKTPQPARDSNYFAPFKVSPAAVTKFEKVIEKGSRILQFHNESGYVEGAIMMIGKAYLYQNETESAAAKFRELLDNFPGSDHRDEARLWYAKALYQGRNDEEALIAAKELAAPAAEGEGPDIPGDILLEITMLEAQIYADRGEYAQAADALSRSSTIEGDDQLKAIAQFQLGSVYEKTKEYERAAEAYRLVGELGPSPAMSFNARLRQGVMLSAAGRPDEALETYDEIIAWPLKTEQSGLVDFEIANSYWDKGDSAAAFTLYDIIDSTYKRTDAAARSYHKRGEIFEKHYRDLRKARKFFESAKSEFAASPVTPDAVARFASLDNYVKASDRLVKDDSTLYLLLNPAAPDSSDTTHTAAGADSAGGVVGAMADTAAAGIAVPGGEQGEVAEDDEEARPPPTDRRGPQQTVTAENLSMRAIRARPRHLVPDPEDPDFAPPGEQSGAAPDEAGSDVAHDATPGKTGKPGGKDAGKKEPKAPLTAEELTKRLAEDLYELGGIFLLDLGLPDSALQYYDLLVKEHPGSPLVPKALYAMSEAWKVRGDTATADSLYDLILAEHPGTDYADQVRKLRGMDTIAAVESPEAIRYGRAEAMLYAGDTEPALAEFKALSAESGDSLVTPKAYYAVGWIYENVRIDLDSAGAWYKLLIKEFPASAYAASAVPRVTVRDDTSKLKQFVKIKEIQAIPKPTRQALGRIAKQAPAGKAGALPPGGNVNRPPVDPDEDEYFNPEEGEEPDEEDPDAGEDAGDEEPEEPDDDPGSSLLNGIQGQGSSRIPL